jgi:penicillin-binding protein 1B
VLRLAVLGGLSCVATLAHAASLEEDLGRNDVRIWSAPFRLAEGGSVAGLDLPERLDRLGYQRVHDRPGEPGEYFWGNRVFWIYRREHRYAGKDRPARLLGLRLRERDGAIVAALLPDGREQKLGRAKGLWLEPELLSESLSGDRAQRVPIDLDALPEHVWKPVLAAEDARFFEHAGLDGRALARAALANVKAGEVTQGGSTITQQLVKNRDLTPKRSLGRKTSEAVRALNLEAEYDKREILQAYLNQVYLGHVEGLAIHGLGTAARIYFSRDGADLTLAQAALLAGMIQGPNRLSPLRHPDRARERRDWVLERMAELGWAPVREIADARATPIDVRLDAPRPPDALHFLDWINDEVEQQFPERADKDRGFVIETTLDARLQRFAQEAVEEHLRSMRRENRSLRDKDLNAALVVLDGKSGEVLAHVGGDPADRADRFDRARRARRQPGSSAKPLLLLEAFQDCGEQRPLNPSTRVADEPLRIELPSGPWEPGNYDDRYRGVIDVRESLRLSLNVPFVRIARHCGFEATAATMRRAGLQLPEDPPPSFSLGAVETSPLELAGAYTVFASPGKAARPLAIRRIEKPSGNRMATFKPRRSVVVSGSTAYLIHDLLRDAVEAGAPGGAPSSRASRWRARRARPAMRGLPARPAASSPWPGSAWTRPAPPVWAARAMPPRCGSASWSVPSRPDRRVS